MRPTDEDPTPTGGGLQVHRGDEAGDGGFTSTPAPAGAGADDAELDDEGFGSAPEEDGDFDAFASTQDIPGPPPEPVTPKLTDEEKAAAKRQKAQEKLFAMGSLEGDPDVTSQTWIEDDDVIDQKVVLKGGEIGLKGGSVSRKKPARLFVVAEVQGRRELVVRDKDTREDTGEIKETYVLRPTRTEDIETAMRDPNTGLLDLAKRILAERGELQQAA